MTVRLSTTTNYFQIIRPLQTLIAHNATGSPGWLRVALEDLRSSGNYRTIGTRIDTYNESLHALVVDCMKRLLSEDINDTGTGLIKRTVALITAEMEVGVIRIFSIRGHSSATHCKRQNYIAEIAYATQ